MRTTYTLLSAAAVVALTVVVSTAGSGPNTAEEYAIRKLIAGGSVPRTDNSILWPGGLQRPSIANEKGASSAVAVPDRALDKPARVVVADSADLAYEYGTFTQSPQRAAGTAKSTEGAYLRVWQKTSGQWKLAAEFRRPYAD